MRRSKWIGIGVGLLAAVMVLARSGGRGIAARDGGSILSECDGQIRSIVVQYTRGAHFAAVIYRQFLAALPADVRVYAVVADQAALRELTADLGPLASRVVPVIAGHEMTAWSRDRWVALAASDGGGAILLTPQEENGADIWPQRRGDQRIAADLAAALPDSVRRRCCGLYFDGGDLLADAQTLFVSPAAIRRNVQRTVLDADQLRGLLASLVHRDVVLLPDAPDHHVGMFMMAAGDGRVVVGDPSLAKPLLSPIDLPGGADFSAATQRRFDAVAEAATRAGKTVVRIACVPAGDGKTYVTYLNGLIDQRGGRRMIYLPQYQGQDRLNAAARLVWQSLGYDVVLIDVTGAFRYFGTLHCLVNVLERR